MSFRKKDEKSKPLARITLKLWPLILLLTLGLGGLSYPPMIRLFKNISTDPVDLLPPKLPSVKTLLEVRKKMETGTRIAVVLESDHADRTLAYLQDLSNRLAGLPTVKSVSYRKIGYDFFDRYKLLFIDLDDLEKIRDRIDRRIQREKLKGLLLDLEGHEDFQFGDLDKKYRAQYSDATRSEYYTSEDGRLYALYVESKDPDPGLGAASRFYDAIAAFLKKEDPTGWDATLRLYLAGPSKVLEYRALIRDLKVAGVVSGIAIFLPLLIQFRNPLTVLLIFSPLVLGVPMGLALGSFFIQKLSVTTSFLFAVLGGLGIETGIHVFSRYHACRRAKLSREAALNEIFHSVGRAILTSVASVAITFLLMVVNKFRGFSEFGLLAGLGLWIIFLLYFSFFPALLIFAEKIRLLRFKTLKEPRGWFPTIPSGPLRIGILALGLFSLYSLIAPFRTRFEYDSTKIRADIPEVRVAKEKQRLTMTRVNNPAVLIIHSREEAEALKRIFKERKNGNSESTIDTTRSYYDLAPSDQKEKLAVIREMKRMLSDPTIRLVKGEKKKDLDRFKEVLNEARPFAEKEVPEEVKDLFIGKRDSAGTLFFINALPNIELGDGRNAMRFAQDVETVTTPLGTYHPSSDATIFGIVLRTMFHDAPKLLILSLLSVSLFVYLDFRSFRKAGLVLLSILMGVFWLLGLMNLFGIKLNFYNMVMLPSVMGVSIDNAIHVVHRYEELGHGSLRKVLQTTGLACLLSSLTNAAGFVGLLFTIHRGLYSMGLLAVLGVGTCLFSTLVFLPAILWVLEKKTKIHV